MSTRIGAELSWGTLLVTVRLLIQTAASASEVSNSCLRDIGRCPLEAHAIAVGLAHLHLHQTELVQQEGVLRVRWRRKENARR